MHQASFFEGVLLDASPFLDDGLISAEVDVGRREITEALVVPVVVVVGDEGPDLPLQVARQEVVLQQDPVLQGVKKALERLRSLKTVFVCLEQNFFKTFQRIPVLCPSIPDFDVSVWILIANSDGMHHQSII
jgi:hypothetical protein